MGSNLKKSDTILTPIDDRSYSILQEWCPSQILHPIKSVRADTHGNSSCTKLQTAPKQLLLATNLQLPSSIWPHLPKHVLISAKRHLHDTNILHQQNLPWLQYSYVLKSNCGSMCARTICLLCCVNSYSHEVSTY